MQESFYIDSSGLIINQAWCNIALLMKIAFQIAVRGFINVFYCSMLTLHIIAAEGSKVVPVSLMIAGVYSPTPVHLFPQNNGTAFFERGRG